MASSKSRKGCARPQYQSAFTAEDEKRLQRSLEVVRRRIACIQWFHKSPAECTQEEMRVLGKQLEHLDEARLAMIERRVESMTEEEFLTAGQIFGRSMWESWDNEAPRRRNAIRSHLGMELSMLVQLGRFPRLIEYKTGSKTKYYTVRGSQAGGTANRERR